MGDTVIFITFFEAVVFINGGQQRAACVSL